MTRPTQLGQWFLRRTPLPRPKKSRDEIRRLAAERLALDHYRPIGPIQVVRRRNLTEDDWRMLAYDLGEDIGPWQAGAEMWGWKALAERSDDA